MNLDQWKALPETSRLHHTTHYREHRLRESLLAHTQAKQRKSDQK